MDSKIKLDAICRHCAHNSAGVCGISGEPVQIHVAERRCPAGSFGGPRLVVPVEPTPEREMLTPELPRPVNTGVQLGISRFAAIWREWHLRAKTPVVDHAAEQEYIRSLGKRTGCNRCAEQWEAYLATETIDTSSVPAYCRGTWIAHNLVNEDAKRPQMSYEVAAGLYGWSPANAVTTQLRERSKSNNWLIAQPNAWEIRALGQPVPPAASLSAVEGNELSIKLFLQ